MKSIKPGRGPSAMAAVGGVIAVIFGIFWIGMASEISGSFGGGIASFFPLFGVLFVVVAIIGVLYNVKNATSKDRFSTFDITDESEESDPLNEAFGRPQPSPTKPANAEKTVRERLSKLEALRKDNLITEDEYQAQRKTIITSL
ncbi:MAG: SHOCT domain-containing protein [Roseibacillus sp.]